MVKQKQYCNKFGKDFKNGPHKKREKKNKNFKIFPDNIFIKLTRHIFF